MIDNLMNTKETEMAKSIVDVTSATWDREVLQADGLVMIVFWADWCDPCMKMCATAEELAREYVRKVKIARLNINDNIDIAGRYKISIIPTVMFFKRGQKLHEIICVVPKMQLKNAIESL